MIDPAFRDELLREDCFSEIVGQDAAKEQLRSALLTERNVIIIGHPGIGKTTLAKNVAMLLPEMTVNDCGFNCLPDKPVCPRCETNRNTKTDKSRGIQRFVRIQGSPDLTSEDLLGDIDPIKALKYGPSSLEAFSPGKLFRANNGVLFFDELNRCPQRLQNSLLQALEEKKVTLGGYSVDFEVDFILIGTMNPHDSSTEKLSDVFMDRFDVVYMDYPESLQSERQIVSVKGRKLAEFPEALFMRTILFTRRLRENDKLEKVPSVRATIGLYERAQSNALLRNRKEVEQDDVKDAIVSVLAHRIALKPSARYVITPEEFLKQEIEDFPEDTTQHGDGR